MKLYFVRHGESVANVTREFSNRGLKHPLTAKGFEQAHALAETLASRPIARLYSSPVQRAAQTAEVLAQRLGLTPAITPALREWDVGILEGTTDEAGWALHRQVQEDWFFHRKLDRKIPGGESFVEIQARFVPFIENVVQGACSPDEEVVLVGHGGLYIAMLPVILKNVTHAFAAPGGFPNTAYVIAETRPDGLHCLEWCGRPMPTAGSEP